MSDTSSNISPLTLTLLSMVRDASCYHISLYTSLWACINMADRKKSRERKSERERASERPVTGRCVACSEGHC